MRERRESRFDVRGSKSQTSFPSACQLATSSWKNQLLIETHHYVVVVLNLTRMPQANLLDKPPQVGNATEQGFGTAGILLISYAHLHKTMDNDSKEFILVYSLLVMKSSKGLKEGHLRRHSSLRCAAILPLSLVSMYRFLFLDEI